MRGNGLLTLLGASALASPILRRQSAPPDPGTPCLYLTTDINWGGEVANICKPGGTCVNIPDNLAGKISSAGPDDGVKCFLYVESYCKGEMSSPITFPGNGDLHTVATLGTHDFSNFDNRAMSFMCSKAQNQESSPSVRREADSPTDYFRPCVYSTTHKNFQGTSSYSCHGTEQCVNFDHTVLGRISSVGPDRGQTCYFFPGYHCNGPMSNGLRFPGTGDMSTLTTEKPSNGFFNFDKVAMSYFCISDNV